MTQTLISPAVVNHGAPLSSSKSSTTASVIALTPWTEDGSVTTDSDSDHGADLYSVDYTPETTPVATAGDISADPDVPIQSVEDMRGLPSVAASADGPVPLSTPTSPGLYALSPPTPHVFGDKGFKGDFTWQPLHPVAPSISLSPPPQSNSSSSAIFSASMPTPRTHSLDTSARESAHEADLNALRLSDVTPSEVNLYSVPRATVPKRPSVAGSSSSSIKLSPSGPATPTTTNGVKADGINSGPSSPTATPPQAITPRQHLSPGPVPTPTRSAQRHRRSSSAITLPRHEVSSEPPPPSRFHAPEFQSALISTKQLVADLADVLSASQSQYGPDSTIQRLRSEAAQLSAFSPPATRTVGFVGVSGVGKSSLINSLLDIQQLAKTSSARAAACTCVVTEYKYREAGDGFEVEVDWFSRNEVEAQIKEMVGAFRHFHLGNMLDNNGRKPSEEVEKHYRDRAEVAVDLCMAMFGGILGDGGVEEVLLGNEEGNDEEDERRVVLQLMEWVDDMPRPVLGKELFDDAETCSQRLKELTSDLGSHEQAALWPFIRKIRVSCDAHILSKGLILVDLPGLGDINSARRNITERYILSCDEIFAVCNIIRAITDESVMSVISLAEKASLSNVGIICTRSDEINAEEALTDWNDERAERLADLQDTVIAANQSLHALEEKVREYEQIELDGWMEGEMEAYLQLRREVSRTKEVVAQQEFRLEQYLVLTRNHLVSEQLRQAYAERVPGDDLAVFCVSNKHYWSKRDEPQDVARKFLELSGMIEVRKHCISIVAESQLHAATLYMQQEVPALLESVQLWVASGSGSLTAEKKHAIRSTLDKVERRLRQGLTSSESELHRLSTNDRFREFLSHYQYQNKIAWVRGASDAAQEWTMLHPQTYAAFCRKFGRHTTRVARSRDWNEEALSSMVSFLSPRWSKLRTSTDMHSSTASRLLKSTCDEAVRIIASDEHLDDDQMELLISSIRTQQSLLTAQSEATDMKLNRDLATLRTDVLSGIPTSFMGRAMNSSYRACNQDGGTGCDKRRKDIINHRLDDETIFNEMEMQLRARFNQIAEDVDSQRNIATKTHFQAIKRNLDMLRDENIILEAESDPQFRTRVDEHVQRVRGQLEQLLAGI